jgi:hypothetical protein
MAPLSPKVSDGGGMGNLRQHQKAALHPAFCPLGNLEPLKWC